jgi:uncharacterized membrane protein YkoI
MMASFYKIIVITSTDKIIVLFEKSKGQIKGDKMKIKHLIGIGLVALLAISTMGFISSRAYAHATTPSIQQVQATGVPDKEDPAKGPDTDQVDEQVGDQNGPDNGVEVANEGGEIPGKDGQDALPSGTPAITADAALKVAQTYLNSSATGKVTLDDENGKLIYSVDINGIDVKVDAISGLVLSVDQAGEGN